LPRRRAGLFLNDGPLARQIPFGAHALPAHRRLFLEAVLLEAARPLPVARRLGAVLPQLHPDFLLLAHLRHPLGRSRTASIITPGACPAPTPSEDLAWPIPKRPRPTSSKPFPIPGPAATTPSKSSARSSPASAPRLASPTSARSPTPTLPRRPAWSSNRS